MHTYNVVKTVKLSGECNSYDREKLNEGYKTCVYKDSMGIPTIGVGFNLKKFGAKSEIEAVGANYDNVLSGKECLSGSQIERLFNEDMDTANACARTFVGANWNTIGTTRQSAVADMAFNLGCGTLLTFRSFRSALQSNPPNYTKAVSGMEDSAWCGQVGSRCSRDVSCMR